MEKDQEFLKQVYLNVKIGILGINSIQEKIKSLDLYKVINEQLNDYQMITEECEELFSKYQITDVDVSLMSKINTKIMELLPIEDNVDSKIAKLMIEGNNKGIIEITENINKYQESSLEIKSLAKKLLKIEEQNLENLKAFL